MLEGIMTREIIAGELDDEEYKVPPILPNFLLKESRKPLVHAIREHKWYLSKEAGRNIGWRDAKKDFIGKGFMDLWEYGFKYGCLLKASPKINPELKNKGKCQDFKHYMMMQIEAANRTMQEIITRSGRVISSDYERELFNEYQAKYWVGGFREGFCSHTCPCHGCSISLPLLLRSEPAAVKREKFSKLELGNPVSA